MITPEPSRSRLIATAKTRKRGLDPSQLLLQIAASEGFKAAAIPNDQVPPATLQALDAYLNSINVDPGTSDSDYRKIPYTDETTQFQRLDLIHVRNEDAEVFVGTYLYRGADLVAKQELVSS